MAKKVLFITYKLQSYRIPILDLIGKDPNIQLTVLHSSKKSDYSGNNFEEKTIGFKKIGSFTYYDKSFAKLVSEFDAVVCMFYLFNLSFLKLAFKSRRKTKLLFWGIGVRASYNSNFDAPTIMNQIRYLLARRSDGMLFYSDYARTKYMDKGIDAAKLFVMNNTVEVIDNRQTQTKKDKILFIGSLYKQKKIFELLDAYKKAVDKLGNAPFALHLVGGGAEFEPVKKWIQNNNLEQSIVMHGAVFEEPKLCELFTSALACVSPGQAGLSVLKSFGYGVPFITHKNAITGGERLNIANQKNGILFDDYPQLPEILLDLFNNPDKYEQMGRNAQDFYYSSRTPAIMANGFIDSIAYVTENSKK